MKKYGLIYAKKARKKGLNYCWQSAKYCSNSELIKDDSFSAKFMQFLVEEWKS